MHTVQNSMLLAPQSGFLEQQQGLLTSQQPAYNLVYRPQAATYNGSYSYTQPGNPAAPAYQAVPQFAALKAAPIRPVVATAATLAAMPGVKYVNVNANGYAAAPASKPMYLIPQQTLMPTGAAPVSHMAQARPAGLQPQPTGNTMLLHVNGGQQLWAAKPATPPATPQFAAMQPMQQMQPVRGAMAIPQMVSHGGLPVQLPPAQPLSAHGLAIVNAAGGGLVLPQGARTRTTHIVSAQALQSLATLPQQQAPQQAQQEFASFGAMAAPAPGAGATQVVLQPQPQMQAKPQPAVQAQLGGLLGLDLAAAGLVPAPQRQSAPGAAPAAVAAAAAQQRARPPAVGIIGERRPASRARSEDGAEGTPLGGAPTPLAANAAAVVAAQAQSKPADAYQLLQALGVQFAQLRCSAQQALSTGLMGDMAPEQLRVFFEAHAAEARRLAAADANGANAPAAGAATAPAATGAAAPAASAGGAGAGISVGSALGLAPERSLSSQGSDRSSGSVLSDAMLASFPPTPSLSGTPNSSMSLASDGSAANGAAGGFSAFSYDFFGKIDASKAALFDTCQAAAAAAAPAAPSAATPFAKEGADEESGELSTNLATLYLGSSFF